MPKKPILTFKDGKFFVQGLSESPSENWETVHLRTERLYATDSYKVALKLKGYADNKALKILEKAFVKRYTLPLSPLPPFLDAHQRDGVRWVLSRSRSYLAHAPGAGKTLEAITAAHLSPNDGQVLFIVPPSLTLNWAREVLKAKALHPFTKGMDSFGIVPDTAGRKKVDWLADILIVPDSMLTRSWVLKPLTLMKKRFVAVDEASRFKESDAERTRALFGGPLKSGYTSPGLVKQARHAVLLDGSPMPNRPIELWAPTYAMSPESINFMSKEEFGFRYCGARLNRWGVWEFKHSKNEEELHQKLTKSFMHVVPESALKHPERRRSMLFMNEDVRSSEQKTWERKHLDEAVALSAQGDEASQGDLARFRRELGIKKIKFVADYVSQRLKEKNESVLLFAWHRDVCLGLERALHRAYPRLVMGGTPESERESAFHEFQNGKLKLIIGNIGAMGRGHNLQRADRVVFAEWSWNDELNKQCEKRASRRGREESNFVRCDYIVCPGSMDEPILKSVFTKAERVRKVIGE